jgi:hypothetical protein
MPLEGAYGLSSSGILLLTKKLNLKTYVIFSQIKNRRGIL